MCRLVKISPEFTEYFYRWLPDVEVMKKRAQQNIFRFFQIRGRV